MSDIDRWADGVKDLIDSYDSLNYLQEVSNWVKKVESSMLEGRSIREKMYQDAISRKDILDKVENDRKQKSFLQRNFGSRKDEVEINKTYQELVEQINQIDEIISAVQEKQNRIPKNKLEQAEMLKKLNLEMKELSIHKREVNESIRQINTSARAAKAKWAGVRGGGVVGSVARYDRTRIIHEKEGALRPLEAKKAQLEASLVSLERETLRISRITDTNEIFALSKPKDASARKCKYCGRELSFDSICPGCGATS